MLCSGEHPKPPVSPPMEGSLAVMLLAALPYSQIYLLPSLFLYAIILVFSPLRL
jgi:hypothetical protein